MTAPVLQAVGSVTVRSADVATDSPTIAGEDVDRTGLLADRLSRQSQGKGQLFLAFLGQRLVGHIYAWTEPAEEAELREWLPSVPLIMNLWVHEEFRRHGVGRQLMATAEEWLASGPYQQVALGVTPQNKAAIALYDGLGYSRHSVGCIKTTGKEFHVNGELKIDYVELCDIYEKKLS